MSNTRRSMDDGQVSRKEINLPTRREFACGAQRPGATIHRQIRPTSTNPQDALRSIGVPSLAARTKSICGSWFFSQVGAFWRNPCATSSFADPVSKRTSPNLLR